MYNENSFTISLTLFSNMDLCAQLGFLKTIVKTIVFRFVFSIKTIVSLVIEGSFSKMKNDHFWKRSFFKKRSAFILNEKWPFLKNDIFKKGWKVKLKTIHPWPYAQLLCFMFIELFKVILEFYHFWGL